MRLVAPQWPTTPDAVEYERKVQEDSFRRGDFSVYFDVFEDGDRLFSSYDRAETVADWKSRNAIANGDAANPWVKGMTDLAKWQIPWPDLEPRTLSLSEVALILRENFHIALNGRQASESVIWPTANNLRQLLHYRSEPWAVRWVVDNVHGVVLRACVAHKRAVSFDMMAEEGAE